MRDEWEPGRGRGTARIVDLTVRVLQGERLPTKTELARQYRVHWRTIHRTLCEIERHVPVAFREVA